MRIISGRLKNRRFFPPKGFPSRPTTDFAKEGLFNILNHQIHLNELSILDLFAGTGSISFEFASREMGTILAVDSNHKCVAFMKRFAKEHQFYGTLTAIQMDALKYIHNTKQSFDVIFADPPYELSIHQPIIDAVFNQKILNAEGLFILEHGSKNDFSHHPNYRDSRKFGHVVFSFFKNNL